MDPRKASELNELLARDPDDAPGIGHNSATATDLAAERAEDLIAAANGWATIVPVIEDAAQAARCEDFLKQLRDEWKKVDEQRGAEKRPHDQAAAEVQKRWRPILFALETCAKVVKPLGDAWLARETARLNRERAEKAEAAEKARREAEAAARKAEADTAAPVSAQIAAAEAQERARVAEEAAAAVPNRARARGNYGGAARSLRTTWTAELTDAVKAARHYRHKSELLDVLTRLASADARSGVRDVPGVRIFSVQE